MWQNFILITAKGILRNVTYSIHYDKTGLARERNWLAEPPRLSVRRDFVATYRNNMSKGCLSRFARSVLTHIYAKYGMKRLCSS